MITLTDDARRELEAYFAGSGKAKSPIRIYLAPGGCRGPRLALALAEPAEADARFDVDGLVFCMDKALADTTGGVTVDLTYMGFTVEPKVPLNARGCGGSCSGGSCGI